MKFMMRVLVASVCINIALAAGKLNLGGISAGNIGDLLGQTGFKLPGGGDITTILPVIGIPPEDQGNCRANEHFNKCYSSSCKERNCSKNKGAQPGPMCTMDCNMGCVCDAGYARDGKTCVPAAQCAAGDIVTLQCGANESFSKCYSSSCKERNCAMNNGAEPGPMCTSDCRQGCICDKGYARNNETRKCVPVMQCEGGGSDVCAKKKCGDVCATSGRRLTSIMMPSVMKYCQADGSCGMNSMPMCEDEEPQSGRCVRNDNGNSDYNCEKLSMAQCTNADGSDPKADFYCDWLAEETVIPVDWCPNSPGQMCRMACIAPPMCAAGQCAVMTGVVTCCNNFECRDPDPCPNGIMMCRRRASMLPPSCPGARFVADTSDPCVQGCGEWDCPEEDVCTGMKCGSVCSTGSGKMLGVQSYCQVDGSCGMNSEPRCTKDPCNGAVVRCMNPGEQPCEQARYVAAANQCTCAYWDDSDCKTDVCAKKKCGDVCATSGRRLTSMMMPSVMKYCQADGSCGMNAVPMCEDAPKCSERCTNDPCCGCDDSGFEFMSGCPAPPMCANGQEARAPKGTCCAGPQDCECPMVMCKMSCKNGWAKGDDGCDMCKCAEPECPAVMCKMMCENGWAKGKDGCDMCKCAEIEKPKCSEWCENSPCCGCDPATGIENLYSCPAPPICMDGNEARPAEGVCCAGPDDCEDEEEAMSCDNNPWKGKGNKKAKKAVAKIAKAPKKNAKKVKKAKKAVGKAKKGLKKGKKTQGDVDAAEAKLKKANAAAAKGEKAATAGKWYMDNCKNF